MLNSDKNSHPDHLNTPRAIYNDQQQLAWRWDQQEPFGSSPANENPSGLGTFEFPLRFPGQYADKKTNLAYNYFRDFDAGLGRYVQSDPIGMRGGLNTYLYSNARPTTESDPDGLLSGAMHYGLTYQAMIQEEFSPEIARQIADAVVSVDEERWSQMPWNAYRHAMCPPWKSRQLCKSDTFYYKETSLARCDPKGFADGLHATQDDSSGSHSGAQSWPPILVVWPPYLVTWALAHFDADNNPTVEQMDRALRQSRAYIREYKSKCIKCGDGK